MQARNCNNSIAKCNHPHWPGQKHPLLLQCILCDWCIEIVKWGCSFLRHEGEIVKWQDEDSGRITGSMRKTSYNEESLVQQRGLGAMKRKRCYYFETSSSHSSSE
jgi:hypothetical protein